MKKHDKRLPNPCKPFYMARLHQQSWVRGDYSDVIVSLSRAFGSLRGDEEAEQKESEKQVRNNPQTIVIVSLFSNECDDI